MLLPINSQYISYTIKKVNDKTVVAVTVTEGGIPASAKKVHISFTYTKGSTSTNPDPETPVEDPVEQPASGTTNTLTSSITIDENTEFPLTGEIEVDGTPESVQAIIKQPVQYMVNNASRFDLAFSGLAIGEEEEEAAEILEYQGIDSPGGIAIKGSHYE